MTTGSGRRRALVCARCTTPITYHDAKIAVLGSHVHSKTNPDGEKYRLGCFSEADCRVVSESYREATWFPDYAWEIVWCPRCEGVQVGWRYDNGSHSFYGLILSQLLPG